MQNDSESSNVELTDLQERYPVLFGGLLYAALLPGKVDKLTEVMNENIHPPKDKQTYERWYKYPDLVPGRDLDKTLALMQDALVEVAEGQKNVMVAKCIKLREQADRLDECAQIVEEQIQLTTS